MDIKSEIASNPLEMMEEVLTHFSLYREEEEGKEGKRESDNDTNIVA